MKKFRALVGQIICPVDKETIRKGYIEGSIAADGSRKNNEKVIEPCTACTSSEIRTAITPEETIILLARMESYAKPAADKNDDRIVPSDNFLAQIEEEAKAAIKRGWDASKVGWRQQALTILLTTALSRDFFTVNDFRDRIKESGITTHDNRAMGGLMVTARNWGWIKSSGDEITSKIGHKSKLQVWHSQIVQQPSNREKRELIQQSLF